MFPMTITLILTSPEELFALAHAAKGVLATATVGAAEVAPTKPVKETKAKESAKAETKSEAKPETTKAEPAAGKAEVTRADVSKLAVTLATKGQRDAVVAILAEFGAQAVTGTDTKPGLSDEDLAAAHAKLLAVSA